MKNSSYNSQIRQLRILAEAALTQYDIGSARLTLVSHGDHAVFRVTSYTKAGLITPESTPQTDNGRFALHLWWLDGFARSLWLSELQWLQALRRETELLVPEPVLNRAGAWMQTVQVEDIEQECICILLRWVPGRSIDSGLTPTLFERVGTFMARLHQCARTFVPPSDFVRPRWDWQQVLGEQTVLDPDFASTHCDGLIGDREYQILSDVAELSRDELKSIPTTADYYGLIHGNLQQNNYFFYKGHVSAIDFHNCNWNYYLFDIAITLSGIAGRSDEEQLRKAFFRGYGSVRKLPEQYEKWWRIFAALRLIEHINILFLSNDPGRRASAPDYLASSLAWLNEYIELPARESIALPKN
ncbi:homoserine kinase [Dictyobacter vulcani]|uniref:Homoserine kinase n=1 Tax=Dictyobacter vulcani TaxID=2607529 RepID=A0A5J4KUQ1_9CHLR|nr:phosphotransferase [Dictyobacter vulcani]GER90220.1 homoserine kinase [Dictyobacter vulcani]